jgi:hypothetical protein
VGPAVTRVRWGAAHSVDTWQARRGAAQRSRRARVDRAHAVGRCWREATSQPTLEAAANNPKVAEAEIQTQAPRRCLPPQNTSRSTYDAPNAVPEMLHGDVLLGASGCSACTEERSERALLTPPIANVPGSLCRPRSASSPASFPPLVDGSAPSAQPNEAERPASKASEQNGGKKGLSREQGR